MFKDSSLCYMTPGEKAEQLNHQCLSCFTDCMGYYIARGMSNTSPENYIIYVLSTISWLCLAQAFGLPVSVIAISRSCIHLVPCR